MLTRKEFVKLQSEIDQLTTRCLDMIAPLPDPERKFVMEGWEGIIGKSVETAQALGDKAVMLMPMTAGQICLVFLLAKLGLQDLFIKEYQRHHEEASNV